MLVNLTPNQTEIDRRIAVAKEHPFDYTPQNDSIWMQYGDGIYQCNFEFNFSHEEFIEEVERWSVFDIGANFIKATRGVADTIDQIKEFYKEEIADPINKYCIHVTPVLQAPENKGKGGGWRWHKWGEYIGTLNPQYEYLDDEDFGGDFKYVICFGILKVK